MSLVSVLVGTDTEMKILKKREITLILLKPGKKVLKKHFCHYFFFFLLHEKYFTFVNFVYLCLLLIYHRPTYYRSSNIPSYEPTIDYLISSNFI